MNPKILVVDDHEIVREGIRTLLGRSRPDWDICGEASNAREALDAMKRLTPDVVIMDITMPVTSGLEAVLQMRNMGISCKVLMFTMHESDMLAIEVRDVGAQGYVLKSQAARDLVLAIERILAGHTFFGAPPETEGASEDKPGNGLVFRKRLGQAVPQRTAPLGRLRADPGF
jgi:DNA-binding NarL/FixJ family response regulator